MEPSQMLGPTFWCHSNKYSLIPHCCEDFSLYDLKNNVEYFFHVYAIYIRCISTVFFLPWGEPLPCKLFLPWKILFYDNVTFSDMNDSFWLFCDLLKLQVRIYVHCTHALCLMWLNQINYSLKSEVSPQTKWYQISESPSFDFIFEWFWIHERWW